jgi:glycosyltransferase involved in cell wall biosynthesis
MRDNGVTNMVPSSAESSAALLRVTAIMAARNAEAFVAAAIESALRQTYPNFELVVVDDASTDQTPDIVASYAAKDARIRLLRQAQRGGAPAAWNIALREARGEWIAVLDADDLWRPRRLELQLAVVDANPSVVLVSSEYERIDIHGRALGNPRRAGPEWWLLWQLLFMNVIGGHSQVLYRRQSALACGGYRPDCRYAEDYQLWIDLTREGGLVCVPEVLMEYRVHGQSASASNLEAQRRIAAEVSDRALAALLGSNIAPEQLHALRGFLQASFPLFEDSLPEIGRNVRKLRRAFWRQHPGSATIVNRMVLAYRIRRRWARYARIFFRAERKRASLFAGSRVLLG